MTLETILKSPTVSIVDVRTPAEFMGGHVADSVNIPLNEVPQNLAEFKTMAKQLC
jgi:phage shock protein E